MKSMKNCKEESKCLASLVVFRELYDKNKDVHAVIAEFIEDVIRSKALHKFSLTEITRHVNNEFDFAIPDGVISTSLGRIKGLKRSGGHYSLESKDISQKKEVSDLKTDSIEYNNEVLDGLFAYIESELDCKLNEGEQEAVVHSFCSFLLDETNGDEYSEYIGAYILESENDGNFKARLNKIREGVVLYSGLKYNNNLNEVGSWKTKMTIFIDTELLYNFAGFDGQLYEDVFNDFHKYVKEINHRAEERLIDLKYFPEVKDEINSFFHKAQEIVEGKDVAYPNATAMNHIVNGCKTAGEVMDKKSDFLLLLQTSGIIEDSFDHYADSRNYDYNLISEDMIDSLNEKFKTDLTVNIKPLNFVNIRRRGKGINNFEKVGYILLTANRKTLKLAWSSDFKEQNNVPNATTLHWITNKFWFKLGKGFGEDTFPSSFDIIRKAQMVLASTLNESIGEKYEELQSDFASGKLSDDQAMARIINLRTGVRRPESIQKDDLESILDVINEDNLGKFLKEREHEKMAAEVEKEKSSKLKEALEKRELDLLKEKEERRQAQIKEVKANLKTEKELFKIKSTRLEDKLEQGKRLDKKTEKRFHLHIAFFVLALVIFGTLLFLIVHYFDWNYIQGYVWFFGLMPILISYILVAIYGKTFNPIRTREFHYQKLKKKRYGKEKYNPALIVELQKDIAEHDELIRSLELDLKKLEA